MILSFLVIWSREPQREPRPEYFIKSYIYHPPQLEPLIQPSPKTYETKPVSKMGTLRPVKKSAETVNTLPQTRPIPISRTMTPVHLIGDKNIDAPLLKLLGEAISANLVYPRLAIDFRIKGTTLVGFTLHPDGNVTNVQVVQSSGAGVLDDAAYDAIHDMSPVHRVGKYLKKTKFMVVGIIFG